MIVLIYSMKRIIHTYCPWDTDWIFWIYIYIYIYIGKYGFSVVFCWCISLLFFDNFWWIRRKYKDKISYLQPVLKENSGFQPALLPCVKPYLVGGSGKYIQQRYSLVQSLRGGRQWQIHSTSVTPLFQTLRGGRQWQIHSTSVTTLCQTLRGGRQWQIHSTSVTPLCQTLRGGRQSQIYSTSVTPLFQSLRGGRQWQIHSTALLRIKLAGYGNTKKKKYIDKKNPDRLLHAIVRDVNICFS